MTNCYFKFKGTGTLIEFESGSGKYTTIVSEIKPNQEMHVSYVDGIFRGKTIWKTQEAPEGTTLCFESELVPWSRRVRLLSNFASTSTVASYFTPLLSSLDTHMKKMDPKSNPQSPNVNF